MNSFVALMLISVSQLMGNSHAVLPNVGDCTFREFTNMERSCTTTFFQGLRRDPSGDCSTKFTTFFECLVTAILKCRPTLTESQARDALYKVNTKEKRYCQDAGMQDPALHPDRNRIPCSQTYFQKAFGCGNETLKLFRANMGDTRLCSTYAEAIKCEKSLIDTECWYTGVNKEIMDLSYDGYNPFCAPLHKNNTASTTPTHDWVITPTPTKNVVLRHLPHGVAFLTWAALITSVLW